MVKLAFYVTTIRYLKMVEGPLPRICQACLTAPAEPLDYRGSRYGPQHPLTRQTATGALPPGVPVPEPFRTWLDLYATVQPATPGNRR